MPPDTMKARVKINESIVRYVTKTIQKTDISSSAIFSVNIFLVQNTHVSNERSLHLGKFQEASPRFYSCI